MKVYFDTEFTGLHKNTTLISIGLIAEDGRSFYAELDDYDKSQINQWLTDNVISKLKFKAPEPGEDKAWAMSRHNGTAPFGTDIHNGYSFEMQGNTEEVKNALDKWLYHLIASRPGERIYMFSDCLAYDWVLFNNIFGTAFDIPNRVHYTPFDLCTSLADRGIDPDVNREQFAGLAGHPDSQKHNALWDATVIKACFENLNDPEHCLKFKTWAV